jgi:Na+/pantothenate symporter
MSSLYILTVCLANGSEYRYGLDKVMLPFVQILALVFKCCVILGKLLHLSGGHL